MSLISAMYLYNKYDKNVKNDYQWNIKDLEQLF